MLVLGCEVDPQFADGNKSSRVSATAVVSLVRQVPKVNICHCEGVYKACTWKKTINESWNGWYTVGVSDQILFCLVSMETETTVSRGVRLYISHLHSRQSIQFSQLWSYYSRKFLPVYMDFTEYPGVYLYKLVDSTEQCGIRKLNHYYLFKYMFLLDKIIVRWTMSNTTVTRTAAI
jgi:hypothetical protein